MSLPEQSRGRTSAVVITGATLGENNIFVRCGGTLMDDAFDAVSLANRQPGNAASTLAGDLIVR